MFSAYLDYIDNSDGLNEKIINNIKNNVSDDVAMYILSWRREEDMYIVQVEKHEYYEAMLPDPGDDISNIELKFDAKTYKRIS